MAAYLPPEASGVCRVGPAVCSQTLARNAHVVDFAPGACTPVHIHSGPALITRLGRTDSSRPPLPGDVSAGCDPRDVPSLVRHIVASGQVDKHERVFEGVSDEGDTADWDIEWLSHDPPARRLEPAGRSIDRGDQPVRLVPEVRSKNYLRVAREG